MNLYIDPGTGSMLFTVIIGVVSVVVFGLRKLIFKIKFVLSGGRAQKVSSTKIPILIYAESKRYWNIFEPICDEFEKREIEVAYWTSSSDDPSFNKGYKYVKPLFIGEGNKAFVKLNMVNAGIVLSTTPSLGVFQWKRSPYVDKYVHILHCIGTVTAYRIFGLECYDAVLLSGEYNVDLLRRLEKVRNLPEKEIAMVGQPFMDALVERIKATPRMENDTRVVLLAPSWGENSIFNRLGERFIEQLVATGYKIIIRPHPQSYVSEVKLIEELTEKFPDGPMLSWNRDSDNFNVLNEADILISDFSSVMYEFALAFDKPLIYTDVDYDRSIYDAALVEEDPWILTNLYRLGRNVKIDDIDNIKEIIDDCIENAAYSEKRQGVIADAWMHKGRGKETVVDYIVNAAKKTETPTD